MAHEHSLRLLTLLTTAIASPLLIATTIISVRRELKTPYYYHPRHVTTFCFGYIPLALTAYISASSVLHHRKHGRESGSRVGLLDALAGLSYLAILIPIWAIEVGRLVHPGFGLLAGYLTAPMIVNMLIHFYFMVCNAPAVYASFASSGMHKCPNCHNNFVSGTPPVEEVSKGAEGYSLLRGEAYLEEDTLPYVDARDSEEQMGPDSEADGKGKAAAEV